MGYEKIRLKNETSRCLLCHDAPCNKACKSQIEISEVIRSLRFENCTGARRKALRADFKCLSCTAPCMQSCNLGKMDHPVDIPGIIADLYEAPVTVLQQEADLSIDFCGIHCENPFFLSSSVVGSNYEMVAKAFDMGWAGVAFKTVGLFIPEEVSPRFAVLQKENNPFVGFKNLEQVSDHSLEDNLSYLKQLKRDYPSKVIIASIMGQTDKEWTELARLMEEAGADMIECNFSCPQMVGEGLGSDVGTNLELVRRYTAAVKRGTKLPVLAKMTPNITKMEDAAKAAVESGADGIAAINTIKSIMNVDFENFASEPSVDGKSSVSGYSGKAVKPIALRFIHDMKKDPALADVPVSGMGGIETWSDALEFIALGCGTVQITTAVMQYGYRIIEDLLEGTSDFLVTHQIHSIGDLVGRALTQIVGTEDLNRRSIEFPKFIHTRCVSCGRCYLSCYDGGHQAIRINPDTGRPMLNGKKCVGCQLCRLVCPAGAIVRGSRVMKVRDKKESFREKAFGE